MNYFERAQYLINELLENRRYFHTHAEVGLHMPKAKAYVMEKLREYGDPVVAVALCDASHIKSVHSVGYKFDV